MFVHVDGGRVIVNFPTKKHSGSTTTRVRH
jgi:hypothetical protein